MAIDQSDCSTLIKLLYTIEFYLNFSLSDEYLYTRLLMILSSIHFIKNDKILKFSRCAKLMLEASFFIAS